MTLISVVAAAAGVLASPPYELVDQFVDPFPHVLRGGLLRRVPQPRRDPERAELLELGDRLPRRFHIGGGKSGAYSVDSGAHLSPARLPQLPPDRRPQHGGRVAGCTLPLSGVAGWVTRSHDRPPRSTVRPGFPALPGPCFRAVLPGRASGPCFRPCFRAVLPGRASGPCFRAGRSSDRPAWPLPHDRGAAELARDHAYRSTAAQAGTTRIPAHRAADPPALREPACRGDSGRSWTGRFLSAPC